MYEYRAKVVRWVDGDTVDMVVDLGFKMTAHQRFRIYDLDTPERGEDGYHRAKLLAETSFPVGSKVGIRTVKPLASDKYGRYLVHLPYLVDVMTEAGLNKLT